MHWVCIYVDKSGDGWYFDSYGLPALIPDHINRIRKNCKRLRWNTVHLQGSTSNVCGQYCIMFLHYMSSGLGVNKFLENFSLYLQKNDEIARNFVSRKRIGDNNFIGSGDYNLRCLQSLSCRMSLV